MQKTRYKPIILITGASSGVGRALAELFYELPQYRTIVTARRLSMAVLRKNFEPKEHFRMEELDILNSTSREQCLQRIRQDWGDVDILINNAGICFRSVVEHMSEKDELLQMQTNYFGPLGLIRSVLGAMREKGRGKIINISSVSGMLAMPTMASYSASKHALEGASEALWYEMRPFGINVTLIQPGFINSNSFQNIYYSQSSQPDSQENGEPYSDYYQNMGPFIEKLMRLSWTTPQDVAQKVLWVVQKENPPLWVPATADAILFYYIRRILPRRWLMPILFFFLPNSKKWAFHHTFRRDAVGLQNREQIKRKKAS